MKFKAFTLLALLAILMGLMSCSEKANSPLSREIKVHADDVTLYARITGDPETENVLIAINGGPGQSSDYMLSLERLASEAFAVVTYDQRGTGRSTEPSDGYGLLDHAADLEAVRNAVGAEKVHIMGHSWGGVVAMRYATVHPKRVNSIVLMGSGPPSKQASLPGQANLAQRIGDLQEQGIIAKDLPTDARELLLAILPAYFSNTNFEIPDELKKTSFSAAAYQSTMSAVGDWDFTEEVAKLGHPVLILWGEDDPFGLSMAEANKTALSAAKVEFFVLKNCGHYWHECPEEFFQHIRFFLGLPHAP